MSEVGDQQHIQGRKNATERRIGIIGAGFTGTLLAAHLLRSCQTPTRIILLDKTDQDVPDSGFRAEDNHIINIRTANMSAYPDHQKQFLLWLNPLDPSAQSTGPAGRAFATRGQYWSYLQDVLDAAKREAPSFIKLVKVTANVIDIKCEASTFVQIGADGSSYEADDVILCFDNLSPRLPNINNTGFFKEKGYGLSVPRDNAAIRSISPDRPVLVLGSSLRMIDTVIALVNQGHRAPLTVLSPTGHLPKAHQDVPQGRDFISGRRIPIKLSARLATIRAEVKRAAEIGIDWRSVVDTLRPHLPGLWRSLSLVEKRRFLRHIWPYWDIHRHRIAPEIAATIKRLCAANHVRVIAGRLCDLERTEGSTIATIKLRKEDKIETISTDVVINATSAPADINQSQEPLIRNLLCSGIARPDSVGIGFDVSEDWQIIDKNGLAVNNLFALGALTQGAWWDITAIPELRNQAARFAQQLAGRV